MDNCLSISYLRALRLPLGHGQGQGQWQAISMVLIVSVKDQEVVQSKKQVDIFGGRDVLVFHVDGPHGCFWRAMVGTFGGNFATHLRARARYDR